MDLEKADLQDVFAAHADVETSRPTAFAFVVSVTRGGLCRRLHYAGFCFRMPGEHYRICEDCGQQEPAESVGARNASRRRQRKIWNWKPRMH